MGITHLRASAGLIVSQIAAGAMAAYAKVIHHTASLEIEGLQDVESALDSRRPVLFAAWHGQTHLLYTAFRRHIDLKKFTMVLTQDARKTMLNSFAKKLGVESISLNMYNNHSVALRPLVRLMANIESGGYPFIFPDGPDGPARIAKPGVVFLAMRTRALIVPVASAARYARHLPRWDRYCMPLPFDSISTVFRPAIDSTGVLSREGLLEELTKELNHANDHAERAAFAPGMKSTQLALERLK